MWKKGKFKTLGSERSSSIPDDVSFYKRNGNNCHVGRPLLSTSLTFYKAAGQSAKKYSTFCQAMLYLSAKE